jgi:hypothetical protein
MKKINSSVYLALAVICSFALMSNIDNKKSCYVPINSEKGTSVLRPNGSPGNYTGSPGDGRDCTDCHDNNVNYNLIPTINTSIPVTGYVLGQTYSIEVLTSSSGANGWGFELTAEKAGGTTVGTYNLTSATGAPKIITSGGSVTHTNNASNSWSFNWTAPSVDEGDITFYAAVLAANGSNDQVITTSKTVSVSTLSIDEKNSLTFDIFPNPSRDYLNIKLPNEISEGSVEIFDFSGKSVINAKVDRFDNTLNINTLSSGMYILRLSSEEKSGIKKFIRD